MKPNIRTSIAYVAASLVLNKTFSTVHDHAADTNHEMEGRFGNGNIDVVDRGDGSTFTGMVMAGNASFYHSGDDHPISMQINGAQFTGRDGGTGRDFNGTVQGKTVKLYDYDEGKYFYYMLAE
jgi:hypothetical protein